MKDITTRRKFTLGMKDGDSYYHIADSALTEILKEYESDYSNRFDAYMPTSTISKQELFEIASRKVNLSSFKVKSSLNPKIWKKDDTLRLEVRAKLIDFADDFIDFLDVDWVKPKDIVFTGSLANYNWSDDSDIDIHVIYDFEKIHKKTDFVREYFLSKKDLWNDRHKAVKVKGFPVELYVEDISDKTESSGTYSLNKCEWIKRPQRDKLKLLKSDVPKIKDKASKFMNTIDSCIEKYKDTKNTVLQRELVNKLLSLFDDIKKLRKNSLKNGEMSAGNVIFKILRRTGYIKKIKDLELKHQDLEYSLKN